MNIHTFIIWWSMCWFLQCLHSLVEIYLLHKEQNPPPILICCAWSGNFDVWPGNCDVGVGTCCSAVWPGGVTCGIMLLLHQIAGSYTWGEYTIFGLCGFWGFTQVVVWGWYTSIGGWVWYTGVGGWVGYPGVGGWGVYQIAGSHTWGGYTSVGGWVWLNAWEPWLLCFLGKSGNSAL